MVVAMRLMRMGNIHKPVYRISVADSRRAPTGKFIEHIGTYNPHLDKMGNKMLRLNVARAKYWIAMGCQPSPVVARLLSRFHLLPVPPQRQLALVDPLVLKVLAGEDVRPELEAQGNMKHEEINGVRVHPAALQNRRMKELTPKRIEQLKKQAPWKLQSFPFDYQPTQATMAAWKQARLFHKVDEALDEKYPPVMLEIEKSESPERKSSIEENLGKNEIDAEDIEGEGETIDLEDDITSEELEAETATEDKSPNKQ